MSLSLYVSACLSFSLALTLALSLSLRYLSLSLSLLSFSLSLFVIAYEHNALHDNGFGNSSISYAMFYCCLSLLWYTLW